MYSVFVNTSSRMITDPFDGVNRLIELIFSHETLVNAIYASITMHAFLLLVNYFLSGVYKSNEALESIAKPFVRLFFLHIAIFILAFVLNFISSDALILLFIFVAFKSFIEAMLSLYNLNKGTELKKQE